MKYFWDNCDPTFSHLQSDTINLVETWERNFLSKIDFEKKYIMDYGIGGAYLGKYLLESKNIDKYYGVDISTRSLETARSILQEHSGKFELIDSEFFMTNFDQHVDIIISQACIQHFPNVEYLVNFLEKINSLNAETIMLQITFNKTTIFNNSVYKTKQDVVRSCHTNSEFLKKYLTNYEIFYSSPVAATPKNYQFLIFHTKIPDKNSTQKYPEIAKFNNIHKGETCVILGTGPTLGEYVPIKDVIHISTNHFGTSKFCSDKSLVADYFFLSDKPKKDEKEVFAYAPKKCKFYARFEHNVGFGPIPNKQKEIDDSKVPYVIYENEDWKWGGRMNRVREWREWKSDIGNNPFGGTSTTILKAFQFALYCGFSEILIVGCDCTGGPYRPMVHNWRAAKKFANKEYPHVKIEVIRPVGLGGVFENIIKNEREDYYKLFSSEKYNEIMNEKMSESPGKFEAQNNSQSYKHRHHNMGMTLGPFRWRFMQEKRSIILEKFDSAASIVDYSGLDFVTLPDIAGKNVPFSQSIQSNSIDVVFSAYALQNVEDPVATLKKFNDIVKDGGSVIIFVPSYTCKRWNANNDKSRTFSITKINITTNHLNLCCVKELVSKYLNINECEYSGDNSIFLLCGKVT